jgi:hypothetical protein
MDFSLSREQLELQARARAFVQEVLQPREVEFERAGGSVQNVRVNGAVAWRVQASAGAAVCWPFRCRISLIALHRRFDRPQGAREGPPGSRVRSDRTLTSRIHAQIPRRRFRRPRRNLEGVL